MLKSGAKRRRPPAEIKAERESKKANKSDFDQKLAELQAFEAQLKWRQEEFEHGQNAAGILSDLVKQGEVKQYEDGTWAANRNVELQQL